jgi:hypothetical protein
VRAGEDNNTPAPEENEVVIFRSFFKAGLWFLLSRFVVEVLKTFQIFLHQLTLEAILRMGVFVWAARSQGIEPSAKCFCSMHELMYEMKATGKEQYHNNFGCYGFIARPNASYPVPTFRKRWPGNWMEEWFYVKNDLVAREDVKEVIMRPIWSRFGLRRPKVEIDEAAEACQKAFGTVCLFIGTRDLIQEHIAFRVWPLVENWEMPKETVTESSEGDLVRLKYTFRYGDKFDEPNDDWLKCIEAISDALLGPYSKAEDNALSTSFGGRGKKRLNRVFDAIGFVYPDYCYPLRGRGKKRKAASAKVAASATPDEPAPKSKKLKVLTHRPRYIEPAVVPEFGGETSSAAETTEPIPPTQKDDEPAIMPKVPSAKLAESKTDKDKAEEPKIEGTKMLEVTVLKAQKGFAATPKRRRMANVLDMLETVKALSSTPLGKIAEASKLQAEAETKPAEIEAAVSQASAEAGPSELTEKKPSEIEEKATEEKASEQTPPEKVATPAPEALNESIDYIICHALGKTFSKEEKREAQHYAQKLKYPKGALVFNGSEEEDFLYCLPDNKEISVSQEIGRSFGFPKLEDGLSVLSKDELADSLAYNSIKV